MEYLTVPLTPAERQALKQLAEAECRPERDQIRWILREAAEKHHGSSVTPAMKSEVNDERS